MNNSLYSVQQLKHIDQVPAELFHSKQCFMSRGFWLCLHRAGVIGQTCSFKPHYLVLLEGDQPLAALAVFERAEHFGEYIFDQLWAETFMRYGVNYYPRLVTCVPYTPVRGARVWCHAPLSEQQGEALVTALHALAGELSASSFHGLFWHNPPAAITQQMNRRDECQFCWFNQTQDTQEPLVDFDHFMQQLTAKKRRSIRSERRKVLAQNTRITWKMGTLQTPEYDLSQHAEFELGVSSGDWRHFYACYVRTYHERGRTPYLPYEFFEELYEQMPQNLALCVASVGDEPVAAALYFIDSTGLYGRHWGALRSVDCLHFELCYYQGIELAIKAGLPLFDPGTQGEHKLIRGFTPTLSHSYHAIYRPEFAPAISEYCERERTQTAGYFAAAKAALPFKRLT